MIQNFINTVASFDFVTLSLWIAAFALCAAGLTGTVVPALPGLPMIFAGMFLAAWLGNFEAIGVIKLVIAGVLTIIGVAVDTLSQMMGAKKSGASAYGIAGTLVGTFAGMFLGLFGILFMPLIGAFVGEIIAHKSVLSAGHVGLATWLGMLVGIAVKLAFAITMIAMLLISLI